MLRRDRYDIIFLDYDLSWAPAEYGPRDGNVMDIARALVETPNRRSIVVVTSHNPGGAERIAAFLGKHGVDVRLGKFADLKAGFLAEIQADAAEEMSE